jgi:hypothetical protein
MSDDVLLHARPWAISHNAPARHDPADQLSWLEIYLTTGLGGEVVVERLPDVTPPGECPECASDAVETVQVSRTGLSVDHSGREEWYCPACGAIESDIPLRRHTRLAQQPLHATATVAMAIVWLGLMMSLTLLVGLARVADWSQRRWPAR